MMLVKISLLYSLLLLHSNPGWSYTIRDSFEDRMSSEPSLDKQLITKDFQSKADKQMRVFQARSHSALLPVYGGRNANSRQLSCSSAGCGDTNGPNCQANSPAISQKTTMLAHNAANDAKAAADAQQSAGLQASHQVKVQLADKACQASNSAQAALAGKQGIVDAMTLQVKDADAVIQEELVSLSNLKKTAQAASNMASEASLQLQLLSASFPKSQMYTEQSELISNSLEQMKKEKELLIEGAKKQIEQLRAQFEAARCEMEDTSKSAQRAAAAAAAAHSFATRDRRSYPRRERSVCTGVMRRHKLLARSVELTRQSSAPYLPSPPLPGSSHFPLRSNSVNSFSPKNVLSYSHPANDASPGSARSLSNNSPWAKSAFFNRPAAVYRGAPSPSGDSPSFTLPAGMPTSNAPANDAPTCNIISSNATGDSSAMNSQKSTLLAQNAADEAEAAAAAQLSAGQEAARQVKMQLADKACRASNSAQVALAGKQEVVSRLVDQLRDADAVLHDEGENLIVVDTTLQMARQEVCQVKKQVDMVAVALQIARDSAVAMSKISKNIDQLRDAKSQLIDDAQRQIAEQVCQLKLANEDLTATCQAAQRAAAAAEAARQTSMRNRRKLNRKPY